MILCKVEVRASRPHVALPEALLLMLTVVDVDYVVTHCQWVNDYLLNNHRRSRNDVFEETDSADH
jgi:hypothetical protein